jgi:hypothetical protein
MSVEVPPPCVPASICRSPPPGPATLAGTPPFLVFSLLWCLLTALALFQGAQWQRQRLSESSPQARLDAQILGSWIQERSAELRFLQSSAYMAELSEQIRAARRRPMSSWSAACRPSCAPTAPTGWP